MSASTFYFLPLPSTLPAPSPSLPKLRVRLWPRTSLFNCSRHVGCLLLTEKPQSPYSMGPTPLHCPFPPAFPCLLSSILCGRGRREREKPFFKRTRTEIPTAYSVLCQAGFTRLVYTQQPALSLPLEREHAATLLEVPETVLRPLPRETEEIEEEGNDAAESPVRASAVAQRSEVQLDNQHR